MYTADHSYFSKKRFESGASFLIGQAGMIFFLIMKYGVMTTGEFLGWATIEFAVAGYMVNQIQKEKSQLQSTTETPPDQPE